MQTLTITIPHTRHGFGTEAEAVSAIARAAEAHKPLTDAEADGWTVVGDDLTPAGIRYSLTR